MASAALNTAAHSFTPYTIPLGPRIRPPRLLPGTKADNTNPQPSGTAPDDQVWAQGKWRNPSSNAAKDRRLLQSKQIEKALRHHTHGSNIYAYKQIRTNQVVYSLTRVMQNNKILEQLVFHRKQTVPESLRRDVWRPYFSIHFPQTPAGAEQGLLAYKYLREIAMKRQLDPPKELLMTTKEDVKKARDRYDPANLHDLLTQHHTSVKRLPRLNQMLPLKWRARKLMDQAATSVADTAEVLKQITKYMTPSERLKKIEEDRMRRHEQRTSRGRRRINKIRGEEELKVETIQQRQKMLTPESGQLGLDKHVAARIAIEHSGALAGRNAVGSLWDFKPVQEKIEGTTQELIESASEEPKPEPFDEVSFRKAFTTRWEGKHRKEDVKPPFPHDELEATIKQRHEETEQELAAWRVRAAEAYRQKVHEDSGMVKILWADMRDGTYAQSWPENVFHSTLDSKAVLKQEQTVVRQEAMTDEEGHEISEQKQNILVQVATSPHIFGRDKQEQWYKAPEQLQEDTEKRIAPRQKEWNEMRRSEAIKQMMRLRAAFERNEVSLGGMSNTFQDLEAQLQIMRDRYPVYDEELDKLQDFEELVAQQQSVEQELEELDVTDPDRLKVSQNEAALRHSLSDQFGDYAQVKELEAESKLLRPDVRANLMASEETEPEARLAALEEELQTAKIKVILTRHQDMLREAGDEKNAASATITPESEAAKLEPPSDASETKKELNEMGVEIEEPKKGLLSRVRGLFGRQ